MFKEGRTPAHKAQRVYFLSEGDTSSERSWILDYGLCRDWCSKSIAPGIKAQRMVHRILESRGWGVIMESSIFRQRFFFFFRLFICFYWAIVNLQCCVSFKCTAKWFSYTYIYIVIHIYILFQILFHYRLLQNTEYSSLCYTVGPCCLPILYIVVCIC